MLLKSENNLEILISSILDKEPRFLVHSYSLLFEDLKSSQCLLYCNSPYLNCLTSYLTISSLSFVL